MRSPVKTHAPQHAGPRSLELFEREQKHMTGGLQSIALFSKLIAEPDVVNGSYDIHWLEKYLEKQ